ncbi:hypothetical protein EDD37DRAFT_650853 [Exophiala viscosa]|uniref:Uncharacterized protein n=1 Tax=Exophiala viscosa TaxID=2486360 RepID=A0AAN6DRU1_9EURO|nr:hypothetical protein EDD36DRAFT_466322 [Exophiala viscosa]KAI1623760.1 hypothetical protein EDD37DRAFT_650853 [Exophiala viscosa]
MGADSFSGRYTPTSPLSPRPPSSHGPLAPQPSRPRAQHGRQASRNLHMNLPRFHPANFPHLDSPAMPSSTVQSPAITLNRVTAPVLPESPRLMREKQREFLERANLSSKIAASSMGVKPGSPRLDPLGSPKGPVTPLALDEAGDYFQVKGAGKISPAASPRSPRSDCSSDRESVKKQKKVRQTDVYE